MILSDLMGLPVFDADERLGYISDIRFEIPSEEDSVRGPAKLIGFIVNPKRTGSFAGYERKSVNHPWLIAHFLAWRHRKAFLLSWNDIKTVGHDAVHARAGYTRHSPSLD